MQNFPVEGCNWLFSDVTGFFLFLFCLQWEHNVLTNQMNITSFVDVRNMNGLVKMEMDVSLSMEYVMVLSIVMIILMNLLWYATSTKFLWGEFSD